MNIKKSSVFGFLAVATLWASGAVAAPAVLVGNNSVTVGTPTAVIAVNWDGDGTVNSAQFRITYDDTELTPVNVAASCTAPWFCSNNTAGIIQFVADQGSPLPDVLVANITFNTASAAIDDYPLTVTNQLFANSVPASVPPSGTTNGTLSVTAGPQPSFASTPVPGVITLGPVNQGASAPTQNISITNNGQATSTLTGTCGFSGGDPQITLTSDGAFSIVQGGAADIQTVSCSTAAQGSYSRTLTCPHNGTNGPNAVYTVNCTINPPPQPAYSSSNPAAGGAINLAVAEAGDPNPSQSLTITNSGAVGTTLTGTCAMLGGSDSQITLTTGGGFSVNQGAAGSVKTVSCDASVQGNYSGTLSCSHNGSSPATPVNYAVSCVVPEAGSAEFRSVPAPGAIVIGDDVVVGDTDPTRTLTFYNDADPGDQLLDLSCYISAGDPQISVIPAGTLDILIQPQSNAGVLFSCDTETSGSFTATYSCYHQNGGVNVPVSEIPNAVYNLSCDVREAEAQVVPNPPSNTPFNASIGLGETATFNVTFPEINDEGEDGELVSCSLDDGSIFVITSPASFPQTIGAGSSVTVTVSGTDPGNVEGFSDTLRCLFSDTDDDETEVVYPLNVTVGGGPARFTVLKEFSDGNPGNVTVDLDCNTGLILDQQKTISEDGIGVTFVVTDFDSGELACNVTERPLAGYSADYDVSGDSSGWSVDDPASDAGCFFVEVDGGDENLCLIVNSPLPVDVVITKEWLYPGSSTGSSIETYFEITLFCLGGDIEGGSQVYGPMYLDSPSAYIYPSCYGNISKSLEGVAGYNEDLYCKALQGEGNEVFEEQVTPYDWPGATCWAYETVFDDAIEVENGCLDLEISVGMGASCTITNTVFFEGIPTLNQYGMALLALLMLGMGFVAVRRVI